MESKLLNQSKFESDIEASVVVWAKAHGWIIHKIGVNGWPDRVFVKSKLVCYIEFKRDETSPMRPLQPQKIARLRKAGIPVAVCWTKAMAINFLLRVQIGTDDL